MSFGLISASASADLPLASGNGGGANPALGARLGPFHTRAPAPAARRSNAMVVLRFMSVAPISSRAAHQQRALRFKYHRHHLERLVYELACIGPATSRASLRG